MNEQEKNEWLERVKKALLSEGFKDTPLQLGKLDPNMVFGLIKEDESKIYQMHVRGYKDGHLESEIEISQQYWQHLFHRSRPATKELAEFFHRHNISYQIIGEQKVQVEIQPPKTLTEWKPFVIIFATIGFLAGLAYFSRERE